jgi:predicted nucleotide-binding protein
MEVTGIAVIGSWAEEQRQAWNLKGSSENFARACEELGFRLAARPINLLVDSDWNKESIDVAIMTGVEDYFRKTSEGKCQIYVRYDDDRHKGEGNEPYMSFRQDFSASCTLLPFPIKKGQQTLLLRLQDAERIIVIGGDQVVFDAALSAAIEGKRVIPIGPFGGAAEQLGKFFLQVHDLQMPGWTKTPRSTELSQLHARWSENVIKVATTIATAKPALMIVHGRSADKDQLIALLAAINQPPQMMIMENDENAVASLLPEKFERLAVQADGVIIVATPDDVGELREQAESLRQRARQNVWLEFGWFWHQLGRKRILLLVRGRPEIPSDLAGIEYVRYEKSPEEKKEAIYRFIERCGPFVS